MNKVFIRSQFLVTALILVNLTSVITKSAQEWPSKATERLKVRLLMIKWLGFFLNVNGVMLHFFMMDIGEYHADIQRY